MNKFAFFNPDVVGSPSEEARERYLSEKKTSDGIHQTRLHSVAEKLSDEFGSKIGHLRKRFQKRSETSVLAAILKSPAALWLSLQPVNTQSVITTEVLENLFNRLNPLPPPMAQPSESQNFFDRIGDAFSRATNYMYEQLAAPFVAPAQLQFEVATRDVDDIQSGRFMGPLRQEVAEAFDSYRANEISDIDFEQRIMESRGFDAVPSASQEYRLATDVANEVVADFSTIARPLARRVLANHTFSAAATGEANSQPMQEVHRLDFGQLTIPARFIPVYNR